MNTATRPTSASAVESIDPLVRIERVTCRYGEGRPVLDDVSLIVRPGSFTGVVGPSGSGKTTVLRLILGLVHPAIGTVERRTGLRVGYVPQVETINWNFPVTVAETVLMSARNGRRWPWTNPTERAGVADVLERLGIGDLAGRHIRQLSGGQQQRISIARVLSKKPRLIFADEPTGNLDHATAQEVMTIFFKYLKENNAGMVLVTHDESLASQCNHIYRMRDGVLTKVK